MLHGDEHNQIPSKPKILRPLKQLKKHRNPVGSVYTHAAQVRQVPDTSATYRIPFDRGIRLGADHFLCQISFLTQIRF